MASKRDQVFAVLDRVAESIEHIEKPVLHMVLPVLNQAHAEVESEFRRWIAQQHALDTFTVQRERNVLLHLKRALAKMKSTGILMETGLKRSMATIGPLSLRNLEHQWAKFSHIFEGTAQPIAFEEAAVLAEGKRLLWPQFRSSAARYAGDIGENLQRELAVSRLRSETIDQLTNRLERRLPQVFHGNRWAAERVARTETLNGYNVVARAAIAQGAEEDPELRRRWDATYDFRRCPLCASLDGQVVKLGEKFHAEWVTVSKKGLRRHALDLEGSPAHPCCRCSETAWRESWAVYSRTARTVPGPGEYREAA